MRRENHAPPSLNACSASSYGGHAVVRWLTVLGVAGILFMSGGCGGGGGGSGGNDDVGATGTGNDTTPNAFSFTPQSGVAPGTETTSNTITVTGIDAPAPISISSGGSYSVEGQPFTSTAGKVNAGQTVAVRHTAPTTYSTVTTITLTIGDLSAPFTTTTAPPAGADIVPDAFIFASLMGVAPGTQITSNSITVTGVDAPTPISISGGGTYSVDGGAFTSVPGTVNNGQKVAVRHTAATTYSTVTTSTLTIGDLSAPFTTTTAPPAGADTVPTPFSFTRQTDVPVGTLATSNPITVTGIDSPAPITITGGTYSINGGGYTSDPGLVSSGQSVTLRHTSSTAGSTSTTTTVTIGGTSAQFVTTTVPAANDTTPDPFSFTPQTGVPVNTLISSNEVVVRGIGAPAPISVTGGTYTINSWPTSEAGTVTNGDRVALRQRSSATNNTLTTSTLTIGGVSATFTTRTAISTGDTTPDPFIIRAWTDVPPLVIVTSDGNMILGIDTPAPISVTGGTYSIDDGPYTSAAGTVINGQWVHLRHTAPGTNNTTTTTTVTIGGVSSVFTSTTEPISEVAAAVYRNRCASCHKLGTLDTTGTAPDLSKSTRVHDKFPTQTKSHYGVTLTYQEIYALVGYFRNF
jgi:hypothetical protein